MTATLDRPVADSAGNTAPPRSAAPNDYAVVPLDRIRPSPLNPRKVFDPEALQELADSIAAQGILEPLVTRYVVTSGQAGGEYEILAGERRWRAARLAGLAEAPVIVRYDVATDEQAVRLMLVENLQRSDLDPIEEALAFKALHDIGGLTQAEIAKAVHRSQPAVANAMRVLDLPEDVRERIRAGELTRGHGVALAKYKKAPALASHLAGVAVRHKWGVADLENPHLLTGWGVRDDDVFRPVADYPTTFDKSVCQSCPFDAYHFGLCLNVAHFRELDDAARAESERRRKESVELAKAAATAPVHAGATRAEAEQRQAGGDEEAAAPDASPPALPKLDDLPYDAYTRFECGKGDACAAGACACLGRAVNSGGQVVEICTRPRRLQNLLAAKSRRIAAENARRKDAAQAVLQERVDALTELGPRELAVLAWDVMSGGTDRNLGRWRYVDAAARHLEGLPGEALRNPEGHARQTRRERDEGGRNVDLIAARSPLAVGKALLAAILEQDLAAYFQAGAVGWRHVSRWYLGADVATNAADEERKEG